jgi:hypothetical protein
MEEIYFQMEEVDFLKNCSVTFSLIWQGASPGGN